MGLKKIKTKMKKQIILAVLLFVFAACRNVETDTAEDAVHNRQLDSMTNLLIQKDSSVSAFLVSFNEIEKNLDSVARKQNIISFDVDKNHGDLRKDVKARINEQITAINALMEKNKKQVEELNRKLKKSNLKIGEFQNIISTLNNQLAQKNTELASLNKRLQALSAQVVQLQVSVDTLSSANYEQSEMIASQTASIHTAYYLVGKLKDLAEMKVIDKDGGLLGIGKTAKLSSEFNPENFTKIDYTHVLTIPINSKKAKIITTHPAGSYVLDKDANNKYTALRIILPEKFWSASKFLVISL